ncbi:hypothetical protein JCM3770_002470 [Rhodotorula araucariae]
MCRWIAYFSTEPILMADVILRPEHSIVKQITTHYLPDVNPPYNVARDSTPNQATNIDGFGVGWYSPNPASYRIHDTPTETFPHPPLQPAVYRNTNPPIHDDNLQNLCTAIASPIVFGHVRASAGSAVTGPNCHPFRAGRFMFMHNGGLGGFFDAQAEILSNISSAARRTMQGTTDSEHIFALFLTFLDKHGPWLRDYHYEELEVAGSTINGQPRSWISLNLALSDGASFLALRFGYPPQREPPSLYWSSVGGSALDRRYSRHPDGGQDVGTREGCMHEPHVVVASEPMTRAAGDQWVLLRPGNLLSVSLDEIRRASGYRTANLPSAPGPGEKPVVKGWFKPRVKQLKFDDSGTLTYPNYDTLSWKHSARVQRRAANPVPPGVITRIHTMQNIAELSGSKKAPTRSHSRRGSITAPHAPAAHRSLRHESMHSDSDE